jgi:hypothetical protein
MKKLKPENYRILLRRIDDMKNYVTNKTIELDEQKRREDLYQKFWRSEIRTQYFLRIALIKLLLSNDETEFKYGVENLLEHFDLEDLGKWFNIKEDKYLELFELVEIDE